MTLSDADRRVRYLRLASTLCYVEGVFMALSTVALGVPALARGPSAAAVAIVGAIMMVAVGFIVAARLLRAERRSGRVIALVVVGGSFAVRLVMMMASLFSVWFVVDAAILVLVLLSWRDPVPGSPDARAPVA